MYLHLFSEVQAEKEEHLRIIVGIRGGSAATIEAAKIVLGQFKIGCVVAMATDLLIWSIKG